ncbi:MAG TPA: hypothetical protein VEU08_12945 [Vicinamibacterales bacterium]|nr:hypothetical protein [Vicinamibacterales bacterium]
MADFNVRSDSVNVEQIMDQIRARIREKRGVDYTEQQIRELAAVKLEKFIDPGGVRSDLLQQFRKARPAYQPPELPNFKFEESTLYESHRGFIRVMRKLLNPILKLMFNPNPLIQALNVQARLNAMNAERDARVQASRTATEQLLYEVIHNLVVELTRTGIEVKNLKMRVESLASRVEFNERRARALESVVVYKPSNEEHARPQPAQLQQATHQPAMSPSPGSPGPQGHQGQPPQQSGSGFQPQQGAQGGHGGPPGEGPGQRSRRRRRRRGRRGGGSAAAIMGAPPAPGAPPVPGATPVAGAPPVPQPSESVPVSHEPEPEAPHDTAADEPEAPEEG